MNDSLQPSAVSGQKKPKIHMITTRQDSLLLACDPGTCGSCGEVHTLFVCREGKSQCVECDKREKEAGSRKQEAATT